MTGQIKTFLEEKGFGFIKGDDGKDYYFKGKNVIGLQPKEIIDGTYVEFDTTATPKGYAALSIKPLEQIKMENMRYSFPSGPMISNDTSFKDRYEVITSSESTIRGYSKDSPDKARKLLKERLDWCGINAAINVQYYKTTGSSGNYQYTIHNVRGNVALIAKKDPNGPYSKQEIIDMLNQDRLDRVQKIIDQDNHEENNDKFIGIVFFIIFGTIFAVFLVNHFLRT